LYSTFRKLQILGQWYRYKYGTRGVLANEGISNLLKSMVDYAKPRPRKPAAIDVYSQRCYQERLKAEFDAAWDGLKDMVPSGSRLAMVKQFIRDSWSKETEAFRKALQDEIDQNYEAELEEWKMEAGTWQSRTAREYYEAMQDASSVLAPFADAMSQRMGMYIAILMVGPLHDGKVGVRR
jgi:hypothetical protein